MTAEICAIFQISLEKSTFPRLFDSYMPRGLGSCFFDIRANEPWEVISEENGDISTGSLAALRMNRRSKLTQYRTALVTAETTGKIKMGGWPLP
jgi:hypothetical protein